MSAIAAPAAPLHTAIGHDAPRIDAVAKVTGEAQFAGDLRLHGMAYGRLLRSPYAHARITGIDTSRAEALPGVIAVMTGRDLPAVDPYYGHALKDRPILAIDRVRFVGEPVVAVAAESPAIADEAITLIDVAYEELPAVVTIDAALAEMPRISTTSSTCARVSSTAWARSSSNRAMSVTTTRSRAATSRRRSPGPISSSRASTPSRRSTSTRWSRTRPSPSGWAMTISPSGRPASTRSWSAPSWPISTPCRSAAVRVVVPYLGGGFGSKSYTKMEPITSALARKTGRPVRIANSVDESMVTTRRHGMKAWLRPPPPSDGRLLAREVRAWFDTGAYADNGPRVVATGADAAPGPYRWEAVQVDAWGVYTNTSPAGSYRAFGASHLQWCGELQVDEIARRCGLDALQIRERNLLHRGEFVRPGGKPLDADLIGDIRKCRRSRLGDAKAGGDRRARHERRASRRGRASGLDRDRAHGGGRRGHLARQLDRGGPGARTVFAQIVAEELALPLEKVRVLGGDTRVTPYDRSTGASRSTTIAGLGVLRAPPTSDHSSWPSGRESSIFRKRP